MMTPKQLFFIFLALACTSVLWGQEAVQPARFPVVNAANTVSLSDFTVGVDGAEALLRWQTAYEGNNAGFRLERSQDGLKWEAVGFVGGANKGEATRYQFWDELPAQGPVYYRLQQVAVNGQEFTFPVIELARQPAVATLND
jgi:hypothetical protein